MDYNDHWYDEDYHVEPEPQIELPESQKVEVGLSINAGLIENAIQKHIDEILQPRIENAVRAAISKQVKDMLRTDAWGRDGFKSILVDAVERRMLRKYPEVVEDKVNEFYEFLKNLKYSDNNREPARDMATKARKLIDGYIENELVDSVKRSKEYIEQFSKNYFANNLFKAMGMMDKMMPVTENTLSN